MSYLWFFYGSVAGFVAGVLITTLLRKASVQTGDPGISSVISEVSSQLGQQLQAGHYVLERERKSVSTEVANVKAELARVSELVSALRQERTSQSAHFKSTLDHAFKVSTNLAETTQQLSQALVSPGVRGQWGERMAEDVLTSAGFLKGINYDKQVRQKSGSVPDFTFYLPNDQKLNMDVKFPIVNYLNFLDSKQSDEQKLFAKKFKSDVRNRVKEISDRDYIEPGLTLPYVLLFVPNESVYGFLHEHDSELLDYSLSRRVVLCSPTSLFAVLAVIRQAVDNFLIEQQSYEILGLVEKLKDEWTKFNEPIEKMRKGLDSAQKAFDELSGQRVRQFSRQIDLLQDAKYESNPIYK